MKIGSFILALVFGTLLATTGVEGVNDRKDRTISKVVKLLQKMLTKSQKEGDEDRVAYAKYKCYVDTNEKEKTESIKTLTTQIELLENKIAELQATNAELAAECAQLSTDMGINEAQQKQAESIRKDSKKAFDGMKEDLEKAIGEMGEAIDVLSAIGGKSALINKHSALKPGSAREKFMSGNKKTLLMSMDSKLKNALGAVSALLPPEKQQKLEQFLQSTSASGSSPAGAIVGILKDMLATFKTNLENAKKTDAAEKDAFDASIETLKASHAKMKKAFDAKGADMGTNDGELSTKKTALDEAIKQKADDEDFLEKLQKMAKKKEKDYDERKMLRANEEAAIAEAISILNSDSAFDTFGTVDATSTGATSFMQIRSQGGAVRQQAEALLKQAAGASKSARLVRVVESLRAGNPFTVVLEEIEKIKLTITEEGEADQTKLDWCKDERTNSNKDLDAKKDEIKTLKGEIDTLDETINDPKTGLKKQIEEKELALVQNAKAQKEETDARKEENKAYLADVSNLVEAEDILDRAISVLKRYYDALKAKSYKDSLVQRKEDPAPPSTFENDYEGQSTSGGKVVTMLEFILSETKKEHKKADDDEKTAESDYQTSMKALKKSEKDMQKSLVKLKEDLAEKEKELEEKQSDLKDTTDAKESIEAYLEQIKPGCDFITANFDLREQNRATEVKALDKAVTLIKDTPAYKAAVKKEAELMAGKCKSDCNLDNTSLKCKACVAGTSEDDYCKSNPGMAGCK